MINKNGLQKKALSLLIVVYMLFLGCVNSNNILGLLQKSPEVKMIGKTFGHMSAKYKKPGNVLVYDSNIAIIRDSHSMYSCNDGASQKDKHGRYKSDITRSGYNFTSPVLYCIVIFS